MLPFCKKITFSGYCKHFKNRLIVTHSSLFHKRLIIIDYYHYVLYTSLIYIILCDLYTVRDNNLQVEWTSTSLCLFLLISLNAPSWILSLAVIHILLLFCGSISLRIVSFEVLLYPMILSGLIPGNRISRASKRIFIIRNLC